MLDKKKTNLHSPTTQDIETLRWLFDLWDKAIKDYEMIPDKDLGYLSRAISELALGTLSRGDPRLESLSFHDPKLLDLHYNFGIIDGLDGRKGKKLWHMQARALKRARRRYHL